MAMSKERLRKAQAAMRRRQEIERNKRAIVETLFNVKPIFDVKPHPIALPEQQPKEVFLEPPPVVQNTPPSKKKKKRSKKVAPAQAPALPDNPRVLCGQIKLPKVARSQRVEKMLKGRLGAL